MLKKLAITGDLASGKSEALKIFKSFNAYTLDADKIAHFLLQNDKEIIEKVIKIFGKDIIEKNTIDRKKIAKIAFKDENVVKLKKFEKAIHPKIIKMIEEKFEKVKNKDFSCFVVEMPLLFEIKAQKYFDITITISTKEAIAKKRYKNKDYISRQKRLFSTKRKEKLSNFVIYNNLNKKNLKEQIYQIIKKL
jgi:dephospho-CoA kinase